MKTDAHRARQTKPAGLALLDKHGDAVHQKRLRKTVHHRPKHRVEAHFVRQRPAEFDQRPPVVQAVAVKEAVQAGLRPVTERLEQKSRNHDGDNFAGYSARHSRVEHPADQADESEVHADDACGGRRVRQAALEDNIHVHQAVTDDGVAEAQRNEHQR